MITRKAEVIEILHKHEAELSEFGIRRLSLFGSFLHDRAGADSDVDILVEFERDQKTFSNFSNLVFFLEELLGRPIELVTTDSLSPHIGPHILREVENVTVFA